MEIGTNELTRPFRIPRRKTGEENSKDGDDKSKRKRGAGDSELRSPLIASASTRKNDSTFSSRIVPPTKRKASQDHRGMAIKKNTTKVSSSGGEVFDKILGSMVNPPKERKVDVSKERDEAGPSGTSGTGRLQRGVRQLTREELERQHVDNSACYAFLRKDGLMERLLGHKMLTGRVDSHVALGYLPFDPNEQAPSRKPNYTGTAFDDFPKICEPPPVAVAVEERRGPRTPPGSPGRQDNSSLMSSRGAASASPSSPPPPPPPEEEGKKLAGGSSSLIAEMAELTKLPHNQLAECLGEELQNAMKQVDQAVLLNTLKDALIKVGKKNVSELESSKVTPAVKEENATGAQQPQSPVAISSPAVEMDIESDKSVNNACEQVLPPPPPAPSTPPAGPQPSVHSVLSGPGPASVPVPPPPCILPTPPPPPPAVLHTAPPPPIIVSTGAAIAIPPTVTLVTAVSAPPIVIPPFNGPPPLPYVPSNPPPSTTSLHQELCPTSVGAAVAAPPVVPPVAAAPVAQTLSFTTPPPPVLPNTAVPPPALPVTVFAATAAPPVPICPREIVGTTNVPSVAITPEPQTSILGPPPTSAPPLHPPPLLPTTSVTVLSNASFQNSVAPPILAPLTASTEESAATRMSILTSQIDFSKPPPVAVSLPPAVQPPPTSQSMLHQPPTTFSVPPQVNALITIKPSAPPVSMNEPRVTSAHPIATVRPTFSPSVSYSNGDAQRPFSELNIAAPPVRMSVVKECFFPPAPSRTETFARSERSPLVSAPPVQSQRPPMILPEQNPSTPTSQNVIRTLMSALAIPQQPRSSPPPVAAPAALSGPLSNATVCPQIDVSQPPPGGSIVNSRTSSPVLLDRYGCPLPVPAKRPSVMDRTRPPAMVIGSILSSSTSEDFHLRPTVGALHSVSTEETPEEDSEVVDFSWPPANFDEQEQTKPNGSHHEHPPTLEQQPKFFSSPAPRPCTSLATFNEYVSSPQNPNQKALPRHPFPPPPAVDPLHAAKNTLTGTTNRPPPLIRNAPLGCPVPPFRPPFANMPFRMRGQPPFPLRRPPPPFGPMQPGARAMRPLFRR